MAKLDFKNESLFKLSLQTIANANSTNPLFYMVIVFASTLITYLFQEMFNDVIKMYGMILGYTWLVYLLFILLFSSILFGCYIIYMAGTIEGVLRRMSKEEIYLGNSYQDCLDNCLQALYRIKFHRYALMTPSLTRETAKLMVKYLYTKSETK